MQTARIPFGAQQAIIDCCCSQVLKAGNLVVMSMRAAGLGANALIQQA